MSKKKVIAIDCDGVLYPMNSLPYSEYIRSFKVYVSQRGQSEALFEEIRDRLVSKNIKGFYNIVYDYVNKDFEKFVQMSKDLSDIMNYKPIAKDSTNNKELIIELSKKYDVYIYTNNHLDHLHRMYKILWGINFEDFPIKCYTAEDTVGDGVLYPKQSDEGLLQFCEKLGVKPGDVTLLDDSEANIEICKKIGMNSVLIDDVNQTLNKTLKALLAE